MSSIHIRPAERGDLGALTDIYNHYVRETAVTFDVEPRTLEQRQAWLDGFSRHRPLSLLRGCEGRCAGRLGQLASAINERAAYDTTVLTSIYLAPDLTGQGIGRRLYSVLFDALKGEDIHRAIGGISLPNEASVRLHDLWGLSGWASTAKSGANSAVTGTSPPTCGPWGTSPSNPQNPCYRGPLRRLPAAEKRGHGGTGRRAGFRFQ